MMGDWERRKELLEEGEKGYLGEKGGP